MAQTKLDELVEQARALTTEEQLRLRDLLDTWIAASDMTEEERLAELDRRLIKKGLLRRAPPPITDLAPYRRWEPLEIEGEPLSQTIIRDRE